VTTLRQTESTDTVSLRRHGRRIPTSSCTASKVRAVTKRGIRLSAFFSRSERRIFSLDRALGDAVSNAQFLSLYTRSCDGRVVLQQADADGGSTSVETVIVAKLH